MTSPNHFYLEPHTSEKRGHSAPSREGGAWKYPPRKQGGPDKYNFPLPGVRFAALVLLFILVTGWITS